VGSSETIRVDVRLIAATNVDLVQRIEEGRFREDLYYRLNVIKIVIPPLRDRPDEILPLAETLLARHLPQGQHMPVMNEELKRFLLTYRWPGNVRELENVMRRFLVYQDSSLVIQELLDADVDHRPGIALAKVTSFPDAPPFDTSRAPERTSEDTGHRRADRVESLDKLAEASRNAEMELLVDALEANRWNRRQAAASLQIEYKAFLYKLQKYGIVGSKGKGREISA
jgi:DNA-binding NtrC family response regulator